MTAEPIKPHYSFEDGVHMTARRTATPSRSIAITAPVGILLLTLLAAPLSPEPYFQSFVFLAIAAIGLAALIWLRERFSGREPKGVTLSLPAAGLVLLTAAYAVQLIWSVYPRGALEWILRAAAAMIVLVLAQSTSSAQVRRQLAWTVLISGSLVAGHGLLQFFGVVPNLLANTPNSAGRIPGLYNYANATAIALAVSLLAGLGLALQETERWRRWFIFGASGLATLTLFLTLSRAVLYGLPIAVFLALVGIDRRLRPAALRFLVVSLAAPLVIGWGLANWGSPVVSRLIDAGPDTQNVIARVQFLKDALAAAADQPWGYGGEGWSRIYHLYQPVNYVSKSPHNHYALTLVEAGVPGLLALLFALLSALWLGFRNRFDEEPMRWILVVAAAMLAGHALIDLDLSRFGLWLTLWMMLGVALPLDAGPVRITRSWWVPAVLCLAVLVGAGRMFVGELAYQQSVQAAMSRRMDDAVFYGQRAMELDPWNSSALLLMHTPSNLRKAADADPLNPLVWESTATLAVQSGDLEKANTAAQQALDLQPALIVHYTRLAEILAEQVDKSLVANDAQTVDGFASELVGLGGQISNRIALVQSTPGQWSKEQVGWTDVLRLHVGKGLFLAGQTTEAEEHLKMAQTGDGATGITATMWLHALYARQGRLDDLETLTPRPDASILGSALYRAIADWQG